MSEVVKPKTYQFSNLDATYFAKTRGKLTEHKLPIFSSFVLYDKMFAYLVNFFYISTITFSQLLKLFSISSKRLKANVKNPDNLSILDFYFVGIVDSISTILILSSIYDFTLYCGHELLHHDMSLNQTSLTSSSYYQAILCFILLSIEIINMYSGIKYLRVKTIEKYESKVAELKKQMLEPKMSEQNKLKIKARLLYYKRRYTYKMGSMMIYFTRGIKPHHLRKLSGRYYRFVLMLKYTLFEVLIVSLQALPLLQLSLLLLVQIVTILIITHGFLIDKIYTHKLYGFSDLLTEFTILFYFIIGIISRIQGDNVDSQEWFLKLQLVEIYLILITSTVNIIQVIYHGVIILINFLDQRKYKVKKKLGNKVQHQKEVTIKKKPQKGKLNVIKEKNMAVFGAKQSMKKHLRRVTSPTYRRRNRNRAKSIHESSKQVDNQILSLKVKKWIKPENPQKSYVQKKLQKLKKSTQQKRNGDKIKRRNF